MTQQDTTTLWRPVGLKEWRKIAARDFEAFPPRLRGQSYFYPVLHRDYAVQIAREWNTRDARAEYVGIVTAFDIDASYADEFKRHQVGNDTHQELWVPADELSTFNDHIRGQIQLDTYFEGASYQGDPLEDVFAQAP